MTDRLRIAYLIPVFPEIHNTFILDQITGLIDRGHEVDLFPVATGSYESAHPEVAAYELSQRVRHLSVPKDRMDRFSGLVRELGKPRNWKRSVLGELSPLRGRRAMSLVPAYTALSFAAQADYDALHVAFGNLSPLAERIVTANRSRARLIVSFRGADTTSYLRRHPDAYRRVFARSTAVSLPVSIDLRKRLLQAGSHPDRTIIHRDGVDLRRFSFSDRSKHADDPTRLLFVGRFVAKKGVANALQAFATVSATRALDEPAPEFTLVGSGPLETQLRRLAGEMGVLDRVRFTGPLNSRDVVREMGRAHILLAPSVTSEAGDMEGVPSVIKEAMATGLPVVSTFHGGIPELVEDGVTGYLVPENDVPAIEKRLAQLLSEPGRWTELGRAARSKVEAEYDVDALNDRLVQHYRGIH